MTSEMESTSVEQSTDKFSGTFLFFGIVLAILGVLAIFGSVFVTLGTVLVFGTLMITAGIAELIHVGQAWHSKRVAWSILSGIIYLIAGGLTMYNPLAGAISFTLIISAFLITAGIIRCIYALNHRDLRTWAWFLFGGIVNFLLGAMIAIGWPVTGLWVIGVFVGLEMLTHGMAWIALSSAIREIGKTSAA